MIRLDNSAGKTACSKCASSTASAEIVAEIASVEGSADDFSPPSPVFQELQVEAIDTSTTEFQLFGRCGKIVCSSAVRIGPQGIEFDTCTRHPANSTAGIVSATYEFAANRKDGRAPVSFEKPTGTISTNGELTIELAAKQCIELEPLDCAPAAAGFESKNGGAARHSGVSDRCLMTSTANGFAVTVAKNGLAETAQNLPSAATMRWKYRIRRLDVTG